MKTLFKIVCLCAVVAACKKSDNTKPGGGPVPAQKSRCELLTNGKWVRAYEYRSYIANGSNDTVTYCVQYDSCSLDDTFSFTLATNKMVFDLGKKQCKGMPFVVDSNSSWAFQNNDQELKTFGGFLPDMNYVIDRLTCDTLIWHYGYINYNSSQTTVVYKNWK